MKMYGDVFYFGLSCDRYDSYNSSTYALGNLVKREFTNKIMYMPTYKSSGGSLPGTSSVNISSNVDYWRNRTGTDLMGSPVFNNTTSAINAGRFDVLRQILPRAEKIDTGVSNSQAFKVYDPNNPTTYAVLTSSSADYFINNTYIGSRPNSQIPYWCTWNYNQCSCGFPLATSYNLESKTFSQVRMVDVWSNSGTMFTTSAVDNNLTRWLNAFTSYKPTDYDPYSSEGGESVPGGGTGTFSETGDTVGIPGLPTLSAVDTGFITLFNPTAAQVKSLAAYMWSSSFDLATFKNIVANPIDCILGLSIVPVNPPNAGSKTVNVGNIPTDVTLPYLSSQYVEIDCGTLNVQEFWGSYLDYSPYTKMSLYLPYIGIIPLDIDDVMNASIEIKYHVDVLSGACVAYVLCNGTQLYTYVGQCSSNVPITSNDFTNTVNGILGIAGSIGKLAADGGASAPTEAAGIAANAINALKPNIQKSGAMSGTGGLMGVQTPYLICQRPRQSVPAYQNEYTGYPSNITAQLSDLSGYTEVESIHLDGLSATQEEQQEIMDLLTSGVII